VRITSPYRPGATTLPTTFGIEVLSADKQGSFLRIELKQSPV